MDIKTANIPPFAHMRRPSYGAKMVINKLGSPVPPKSALKKKATGLKPSRHISWSQSKPRPLFEAPTPIKPQSIPRTRSLNSPPPIKKPQPTKTHAKATGDIFPAPPPRIPARPLHRKVKIRINPESFRKLPDSILSDIAWFLIHKYRNSPLWNNEDKFVDFIMRQLLSFEYSQLQADS